MGFLSIQSKTKKSVSNQPKEDRHIPDTEVAISEDAASRILDLLNKQNMPKGFLRVGVQGGGCSGLSYHFELEQAAKETDHLFEYNGARVCIDPKSLRVIGGSLLDWQGIGGKKELKLINPKLKKSCSCGESFSI